MKSLTHRLDVLERADPGELSPAIRAWLGWPLTDVERQAVQIESFDHAEIDVSRFNPEVRAWLGV